MTSAHSQTPIDDTKTLPADHQDTISMASNSEIAAEATSPRPTDITKATQEPPRSPKRKATDDDEASEPIQTVPKKRKVTFNTSTFVRAECDIDILRHQSSDDATKYTTRPLIDTRSRRRSNCRRKSGHYLRGDWAVKEGSENVNTSGRSFDFPAWERYVKELEQEGKEIDEWDEMLHDPQLFLQARTQVEESQAIFLGAVVAVARAYLVSAAVIWRVLRRR